MRSSSLDRLQNFRRGVIPRHGRPYEIEKFPCERARLLLPKTGGIKQVTWGGPMMTPSDGNALLHTLLDAADHTLTEEMLRLFRSCVEYAPESVFIITHDGGFLYVNEQAGRSLGYSRSELLQLKLWEVDPYIPQATWSALWAEFQRNKVGVQQVELLHRHRDGSIFPVEVSAKHLWLGDHDYHVAFVRDIRERKQAEAAIREREARFRSLFEKSADAILLFEDGVFTDCNQSAVDMMRARDKTEFLARHPAVLSPEYQPDGRLSHEKGEELIRATLEKGNNRFEWVHRRTDGSDFPVEVLLTKISLDERQVLYTVWRDITERKQAEAALQMYQFAMENAPEAVFFMRRDGGFSNVNAQACISLNYRRDELLALRLWDIDPAFPRDAWDNMWTQDCQYGTDVANIEVLHRRKDGRFFPVYVCAKHLWLCY